MLPCVAPSFHIRRMYYYFIKFFIYLKPISFSRDNIIAPNNNTEKSDPININPAIHNIPNTIKGI